MARRKFLLLLSLMLVPVLTACSGASVDARPSPRPNSESSNTNSINTNVTVDNGFPDHMPGPADVSTMETGKPFMAIPNFHFFSACGRPCWLPLYAAPSLDGPNMVTSQYPYESLLSNSGNHVSVVCQTQGGRVQNDALVGSTLWDKIIVRADTPNVIGRSAITRPESLKKSPDGTGYFAYGADIWLGNTGSHGIPC